MLCLIQFATPGSIRPHPHPGLGQPVSHRGEDGSQGIYAVVYGIRTEPLDPSRPIVARGQEEDREEDIYRSNPQLARLMSTRLDALIVGHGDGANVHQYLPGQPPRIHAFVYSCTPEETEQFTRSLDYLNLLVNSFPAGRGMADEVIAACLRHASAQVEDSRDFLVRAARELAGQLAEDVSRLNSILRRLSPWPAD